jgi:hypothetical protein
MTLSRRWDDAWAPGAQAETTRPHLPEDTEFGKQHVEETLQRRA